MMQRLRTWTAGVAALLLGAIGGSAAPVIDAQIEKQLAAAYRVGLSAYGNGDFREARRALERAAQLNPDDDLTVYLLAATAARARDERQAARWVQQLARMKSCLIPTATAFATVNQGKQFKAALAELRHRQPSTAAAQVAFRISEPDLLPEGIAYDPVSGQFFLGSLRKGKIVQVQPGGRVQTFASEKNASFLGLRIDWRTRRLWALSSPSNLMENFQAAQAGHSTLFQFDLDTGKRLARFDLSSPPNHLLNDLEIDGAGNIYATDTETGAIYLWSGGEQTPRFLVLPGKLSAPNGIALSGDGRKLFVAEDAGIARVDLTDGSVERVLRPRGPSPLLLDGLYYRRGSLIGVLGGIGGGRVMRFVLDPTEKRIARTEVLDCNHPAYSQPTTGALAADAFYFIANSQLAAVRPDGSLPRQALKDVVVLKVPLPAGS